MAFPKSLAKSLAVLVLLAAAISAGAEECDATDACCEATCDDAGSCIFTPAAVGTECRDAADACEEAATCDGVSTSCPATNPVKPVDTACGEAVEDCQNEPVCDGTTAACPAPTLKAIGTVCRSGKAFANLPPECSTCQGGTSCPSASSNANCNPKKGRRLSL